MAIAEPLGFSGGNRALPSGVGVGVVESTGSQGSGQERRSPRRGVRTIKHYICRRDLTAGPRHSGVGGAGRLAGPERPAGGGDPAKVLGAGQGGRTGGVLGAV